MASITWRAAVTVLALSISAISGRAAHAAAPDDSTLTVFLVRHAEKDTTKPGNDPPLTTAGIERANLLARMLGHAEISTVFVTEWQRTRATAEPIARTLKDSLHVLRGRDVTAHAGRIRNETHGGTALVVGHSNTLPALITALTGKPVPPIRDEEHDRLYVVVLYPGGSKIMWFTYGEPPPPSNSEP